MSSFEGLGYSDQGRGDAVILLNGWPADSFTWRRLTPMLALRFRTVVPDLTSGDIREQADQVRGLLQHLQIDRYAVIAHSHGGAVAQLLALGGPQPSAMILMDPVVFDACPPDDLEPLQFIQRGSVEFDSLTDHELEGYLRAPTRQAPALNGALMDRESEMASWEFPVMLLWGEEDPYVPLSVGERLNAAIPTSVLGIVPESGHFLLDDAFDSVGSMMSEYLRARYLGAPHGHEGKVHLELERRPPRVDLAAYETPDQEPTVPDPSEQEVGPNA